MTTNNEALKAFSADVVSLFPDIGELKAGLDFQDEYCLSENEFLAKFEEVASKFALHAEIADFLSLSHYSADLEKLCKLLKKPENPKPAILVKVFSQACTHFVEISEAIRKDQTKEEMEELFQKNAKLASGVLVKLTLLDEKIQAMPKTPTPAPSPEPVTVPAEAAAEAAPELAPEIADLVQEEAPTLMPPAQENIEYFLTCTQNGKHTRFLVAAIQSVKAQLESWTLHFADGSVEEIQEIHEIITTSESESQAA